MTDFSLKKNEWNKDEMVFLKKKICIFVKIVIWGYEIKVKFSINQLGPNVLDSGL